MWKIDKSGVRHWKGRVRLGGNVNDAAIEALNTRVHDWPCWFWFNDTFAPMAEDDTVDKLVARWHDWRRAYHASMLIEVLSQWSAGE